MCSDILLWFLFALSWSIKEIKLHLKKMSIVFIGFLGVVCICVFVFPSVCVYVKDLSLFLVFMWFFVYACVLLICRSFLFFSICSR